jgi:hypothetical protein
MEKVDVSKFPPESSFSEPGSRDGQQKIVRSSAGGADAYGWSAVHGTLQKIGEVTGRAAVKSEFEGRKYDHVLPVAMGDGAAQLKIAFNDGDDARVVADAFIKKNGLQGVDPQQIIDFVKSAQQPVALADARRSFPCSSTEKSSAPLPSAAVVPKLVAKINQFNEEFAENRRLQLTPPELNAVQVCCYGIPFFCRHSLLKQELLSADIFTEVCKDAIIKGMQWPHYKAFPILDVLRTVAVKSSSLPFC